MTKNRIVQEVYEELGLQEPDWIPEEYEKYINSYADSFSGKNQLPVKDSDNNYMYPIDREMVRNRVTRQLMNALMDGEEVPENDKGVEMLLTKNPKYPIMLTGTEERVLCRAIQESATIENPVVMECVRNELTSIAITFLSPRIKFIYRKFEKAIGTSNCYEDVIQEMMFAMLKMLEDFNFERTTAGITKDFLNTRMFRAINIALSASRSSDMAQETWNKVNKFVNHPEDHKLSKEEIKQKYHCSSGLVDIMFTFVENGSLEISMDYTPVDIKNSGEKGRCTIGDMIQAKDYSEAELELDMTLRKILPEIQYKVIKLKLMGYSHQMIADMLGFDSKRKSQYVFICARNIIEKEFNVNIEEYSKGQSKYRRRLAKEASLIQSIEDIDDIDEEELAELVDDEEDDEVNDENFEDTFYDEDLDV